MKFSHLLFISIWFGLFTSLISKGKEPKTQVESAFQSILDSADLNGAILILDDDSEIFYSNNFERARTAYIPASTFKIPNTLIALEEGIVENENAILAWDGEVRGIDNWNQDLTLKQAFHYSCVPCYQEIARSVGPEKMNDYVSKLGFGEMDISGSNIDEFWLLGKSKISPFNQIDFLQRYRYSELGISKRTEGIAKKLMVSEEGDGYKIISKTGWSSSGVWWYVGYVVKGSQSFFFATNVDYNAEVDPGMRIEVTKKALQHLEILPALRP